MAYKPVGVESDGSFPTRVMNRLKTLIRTTNSEDLGNGSSTLRAEIVSLIEANSGDGAVISVAGRDGEVVLTSTDITNFVEAAQDAVAAMLAGASGVTLNYNDAANTLTITGGGSGGLDEEAVRDAIGVALVGTGYISVVVNDAADTITITGSQALTDALAGKAASAHTHASTDISDSTSFGRALLTAASVAAQKTLLALTKSDVGLANVDNTADTAKPVSTAQSSALALKAPIANPVFTGTTQTGALYNSGARRGARAAASANVSISSSDVEYQDIDAAGANRTVSLSSSSPSGYTWTITKMDSSANTVTVSATTINGSAAPVVLTKQGDFVTVISTTTAGAYTAAASRIGGPPQPAGAALTSSDGSVLDVRKVTQAQYDAISPKVATTVYFIAG